MAKRLACTVALVLGNVALAVGGATAPGATAPGATAPGDITLAPAGPAIVRADTAALVLSGQSGGAIRLAVRVVPPPVAEGLATVLVRLDGTSLAVDPGATVLELEAFVYALGARSEVLGHASQRFAIDLASHGDALAEAGLALAVGLAWPAVEHDVRVLVRRGDGAFGMAGVRLAPDAGESSEPAAPAVSGPGKWLVSIPGDEPAPPWPELPAAAANRAAAPVPETVLGELAERRENLPRQEIVASYLAVLGELAGGDRDAALGALYELEGRCAGDGAAGLDKLATAQGAALVAVARESWLALLPVLLLHADAADGYARNARFLLSRSATSTVVDLAKTWAEKVSGKAARRVAARLVAGMAGDALRRSSPSQAQQLLAAALEHDDDEGALLALAALHDRAGRPDEAIALLERLTEKLPAHDEGNLRLAVSLAKTDRRAEGESLLRRLCVYGGGWAAILACEERARLAARRDETGAAEGIVAAALVRWPGHPTLVLQRAFLLDLLGRPREAAALAAKVDRSVGREGSNERFRFNQWPLEAIDTGRRDVDERAARRLDDLARALASIDGAPPKT